MLIRIFKSGYIFNIILFVVVSLLLWLDAFINPPTLVLENEFGVIYKYLGFLAGVPLLIAVIMAFILLLGEAIMLNSISKANPIFSKSAFLPALVYVILMSYLPKQLTINPILIANFFTILALKNLVQSYGKNVAFRESFNASIWISVASMIHFPLMLMIIFIWVSFLIYRISSWREWFISIMGFIVPYFFLLSFYFLTDGLGRFYTFFIEQWAQITRVQFAFDGELFLFWVLFLLIMGISFLKLLSERGEKLISIRKQFNLLAVMFFSCLVVVVVSGSNPINLLHLLFVPASMIMSFFFIETRRVFYAELFFSLLLIVIFVNKFT